MVGQPTPPAKRENPPATDLTQSDEDEYDDDEVSVSDEEEDDPREDNQDLKSDAPSRDERSTANLQSQASAPHGKGDTQQQASIRLAAQTAAAAAVAAMSPSTAPSGDSQLDVTQISAEQLNGFIRGFEEGYVAAMREARTRASDPIMQEVRPRSKVKRCRSACVGCRSSRMRCVMLPVGSCSHCVEQGIACIPSVSKKRGPQEKAAKAAKREILQWALDDQQRVAANAACCGSDDPSCGILHMGGARPVSNFVGGSDAAATSGISAIPMPSMPFGMGSTGSLPYPYGMQPPMGMPGHMPPMEMPCHPSAFTCTGLGSERNPTSFSHPMRRLGAAQTMGAMTPNLPFEQAMTRFAGMANAPMGDESFGRPGAGGSDSHSCMFDRPTAMPHGWSPMPGGYGMQMPPMMYEGANQSMQMPASSVPGSSAMHAGVANPNYRMANSEHTGHLPSHNGNQPPMYPHHQQHRP